MAFITPLLPRPTPCKRTFTTPLCSTAPAQTSTPPRVIPTPLPNVLVYDHCPFCVRVRHALGLKNVKHNLIWLANDDVTTPTSLVGKKIVPIFQPLGSSGPSQFESLDIVAAIDSDERYGSPGFLKAASGRTDIDEWMGELAWPMRRLTRVRFSQAPLPEFAFREAREAYVRNHALPESYEENFERSPEFIKEIQDRVDELGKMIYCREYCTEGGVGYDDIALFPRLRNLTIVKGLILPDSIREYVEFQAERAEVPLYDYCAM